MLITILSSAAPKRTYLWTNSALKLYSIKKPAVYAVQKGELNEKSNN